MSYTCMLNDMQIHHKSSSYRLKKYFDRGFSIGLSKLSLASSRVKYISEIYDLKLDGKKVVDNMIFVTGLSNINANNNDSDDNSDNNSDNFYGKQKNKSQFLTVVANDQKNNDLVAPITKIFSEGDFFSIPNVIDECIKLSI